jgi:hypothetical protein
MNGRQRALNLAAVAAVLLAAGPTAPLSYQI